MLRVSDMHTGHIKPSQPGQSSRVNSGFEKEDSSETRLNTARTTGCGTSGVFSFDMARVSLVLDGHVAS